jgi:hypothetical protein
MLGFVLLSDSICGAILPATEKDFDSLVISSNDKVCLTCS